MIDQLKGIFGGGDANNASQPGQSGVPATGSDKEAQVHDFIQRATSGNANQNVSNDEVAQHFNTVMQHASPEVIQNAAKQTVNNMSPAQRSDFAKMLQERQAGQGFVPIEQAGGGTTTSPSSGGGIDDILGGLLGGGQGSSGGLGGLLGGLLGGGGGAVAQQPGASQSGGASMGGLGDLMKSPIGKMLMAGIAAYGMKELMGKR